jgi:hypothetical protein
MCTTNSTARTKSQAVALSTKPSLFTIKYFYYQPTFIITNISHDYESNKFRQVQKTDLVHIIGEQSLFGLCIIVFIRLVPTDM